MDGKGISPDIEIKPKFTDAVGWSDTQLLTVIPIDQKRVVMVSSIYGRLKTNLHD